MRSAMMPLFHNYSKPSHKTSQGVRKIDVFMRGQ